MKITNEAVHEIYKICKNVYFKKIRQSEALKLVKKEELMARGSASNYIGNFKCMMQGVGYKRAMSVYSTEYFLRNIHHDFGIETFSKSISSATEHLIYYHSLNNGRQVTNSNLIESLIVEFEIKNDEFRVYPDELDGKTYKEGAARSVTVNAYERSEKARKECIEFHGLNCKVCDFNFAEIYGDLGIGFIHVHHILDISEVGEEYDVRPKEDLIPVCANCHAMLHRVKPAMSVESLQTRLKTDPKK